MLVLFFSFGTRICFFLPYFCMIVDDDMVCGTIVGIAKRMHKLIQCHLFSLLPSSSLCLFLLLFLSLSCRAHIHALHPLAQETKGGKSSTKVCKFTCMSTHFHAYTHFYTFREGGSQQHTRLSFENLDQMCCLFVLARNFLGSVSAKFQVE